MRFDGPPALGRSDPNRNRSGLPRRRPPRPRTARYAPPMDLVAKLGTVTNSTHGFIYFSESAGAAYEELGLTGRQQYFASRGAALGAVPAEVVIATFFNFNPEIVRQAIPAAWDVADPAEIQAVRMRAAGAQLAQLDALPPDHVAEATALAGRMIAGVTDEGRPLGGANRAVPEPDDPWERLWQRVSVIREWRGDAHVAVLAAAPLTAVEALVLHAATGQVPRAALQATRQWDDAAWNQAIGALAQRGLVQPDGSFTDEGRSFRADIERQTNAAAAPLVDAIGPDDTARLIDLLAPIQRALVDSGAFARLQSVRNDATPRTE